MALPDKQLMISVLIPDAETTETLKVLRCLNQASTVKVYILSRNRWSMARFSRYRKGCYHNKSRNEDDWVSEVIRLVRELEINIVLPVTVDGVKFVSKNREAISEFAVVPPLAKPEQIEMADNKWAFHKFLEQHGLPSVPTILIGKAGEDIPEPSVLDSIEYPALLKPVSQKGGFGIVKVKDASDFDRAWHDKSIMKGRQYILQSFVKAFDYSLSVCCKRGEIIAYTLYRSLVSSENPYEIGKLVEYVNDEQMLDVGRRLVSAMGWEGVADIDILFDESYQKMMILEFNPRFWQSLLGGKIAGVNFPLTWCLNAMGTNQPSSQYAGTRYARPSLYIKTLFGRLTARKPPMKIRWSESDLQFVIRDPLPELVYITRKIVNRFKGLKKGKN